MTKLNLSLTFALLVLSFITFFSFSIPSVESAAATHVVISEIMEAGVGTGHSNDEFVELYNPTGSDVNLSNWRLTKKPQDGSPETDLIATMSGTIKSHGFFLIAHPESPASSSADMLYTNASATAIISNNNTISLYDNSQLTPFDKVGMGIAIDSESTPSAQPDNGNSLERKANSSSTEDTMKIGGSDEFAGNGEDTDNNGNDFITRDIPQPQNSSSPIEPPAITPTPTNTPTPTIIVTPTLTPTPTVTVTPTSSPTPTITPTLTLTPTVTTTPSATPVPNPNPFNFARFQIACNVTYTTVDLGFVKFQIPHINCRVLRF